jgi:VanZ family protein
MARNLLRWAPPLLWMGVIFYFSGQSRPFDYPQISDDREGLGILAHLGEYFLLSFLLYRAFERPEASRREAFWPALLVTMLFALSDELHQRYIPGREFTLFDLGLDLAGALGCYAFLRWLAYRRAAPAERRNASRI